MDVDLDNTDRFEIGWSVLNSQRNNNEEEFNYLPDETLATINTEDLLIPDKNNKTKETPQRFKVVSQNEIANTLKRRFFFSGLLPVYLIQGESHSVFNQVNN